MNPEDLKLPKLGRESFQLADTPSRFAFPFPSHIAAIADPGPILQYLEPGETRQVLAAYARYQAASAQAAVELFNTIAQIAQTGSQTGQS